MSIRQALHCAGWIAVATFLLLLNGCGGAGSETTVSVTASSGNGTVLQGTVMLGASPGVGVTAVELNPNGTEWRVLGQTTTDAEGIYRLTLGPGYGGGSILLKAAGGVGAAALCDVVGGCGDGHAWGDAVPLGSGFEMRALVPPVAAGTTVSAQITPFTHMATARARANPGGVTAAVIRDANSEASRVTGVDVLTTVPLNLLVTARASTPEERVYAAFISAASAWMVQNGGFEAGLSALAQMFVDGAFSQVDGDYAFIQALQDYLRQNGDQLFPDMATTSPEVAHAVAVLDGATTCDAAGSCSFDPVPEISAPDPAVARAKALVTELRGWFFTVGDLKDPLSLFSGDLTSAAAVFDADGMALLGGMTKAFKAVVNDMRDRALGGLAFNREYVAVLTDNSGQRLGQVLYMLRDQAGKLAIDLYGTDVPGLNLTVNVDTGLPSYTIFTWSVWNLQQAHILLNGSLSNTGATVDLTQVLITLTLEQPFTFNPLLANSPPEPVIAAIGVDGHFGLSSASGSFNGKASFDLVPPTSSTQGGDPGLRWCRLDGLFLDASTNTFGAKLELFVNGDAQFDSLAYLAGGSPGTVSDSYFANAALSLTLGLDLTGHPPAVATVTVNRAGLAQSEALVTLAYDGHMLTFEGAKPTTRRTDLRVSSPDGVAITLAMVGSSVSGSVEVQGVTVAQITTETNGLVFIRYQDGTFETLE